MCLAFSQGIIFNVCDYRFENHPNIDVSREAVFANVFFGTGAETGIFMPIGRKRKYRDVDFGKVLFLDCSIAITR